MISTDILNKHELNDKIHEYQKNLLTTVLDEVKILKDKFSLLQPGNGSFGDEYWFIILIKVQDYLSIDYEENNLAINQLEGILRYIQWFNSMWPPRKDKKGNYKLPKRVNPPEISLFNNF